MALTRVELATEPDFSLGLLKVSPSTCRVKIGDDEVRIEAQTMTVLVALARADGGTLGRDALTDACWNGRVVSDDAITRTIAKVRAIVRGADPPPFTLETLPRIGYRLIVHDISVDGEMPTTAAAPGGSEPAAGRDDPTAAKGRPRVGGRAVLVAAAVAIALPLGWAAIPHSAMPDEPKPGLHSPGLPAAGEVSEALILLDRARVLSYLERGWNPNWKLDSEGGDALQTLLLACERNPTHNRGMVARIAQDLVIAGVDTSMRNKWGDTALDIARAPRYCGPQHPVVEFLASMTPPPKP